MTISVSDVKTAGGPAQALSAFGRMLLDQLYPPSCLNCDAPVAEPHGVCPACFSRLVPITEPMCPVLGVPFAHALGPDALSAQAIAEPPPFDRSRSAFVYGPVSGRIVSRLKYGDRPELARFAAGAMRAAGHAFWSEDTVVVPVPLHPSRQWQRRYNQSAELAREIARLTGARFAPGLARRTRRTVQQVGLSGEARRRNVAGAFKIDARMAARFAGQHLVLIDDVITTGATVSALARTLKRGGFDRIDVLSLARVVIGSDAPI